jgi:hypothetical protein
MQIKKVLAHTCFQLGRGLAKDQPLSPKKCRCRQYVSVTEAAAEVALGLAQYVVAVEKVITTEEVCRVCANLDPYKKSCVACSGSGITVHKNVELVRGEDIIRTVSADGKDNVTTSKVKKSPTIEKAHIERAYINNLQAEQLRIEAYGALNADSINALITGYEPEDDLKTHTGRRYDYGRAL